MSRPGSEDYRLSLSISASCTLLILPRFRRDYRTARKHPEFDAETLEYVFDLMIAGEKLPEAFQPRSDALNRPRELSRIAIHWIAGRNAVFRTLKAVAPHCRC